MRRPPPSEGGARRSRLIEVGRYAWAALGIVGVLVAAYLVLSRLAVVVVPLLLAFFVAGALEPMTRRLHLLGVPRALAALLSVLVAVAVFGGVIALIVPAFQNQVPVLIRSVQQALGQLERLLGPDVDMQSAVSSIAMHVFGGGAEDGGIAGALDTTVSVVGGLVLALVVAFFYLAEGRRLASGLIGWLPAERRASVRDVAERLWETIGLYVRGILLVALIDAIGIGLGVYLLGVPLALPIAVLVYLGAFVPVAGAFVTGLLAVLVAFAHGGWWLALGALLVVLVVQQIEGNVLQPLVMGKVIRLPAFVILVAVALGFAWLGIFGAFLAVPVAASVARISEYLAERRAEGASPGP